MFAIIAVFIAGLMVGRTPEYLGKKIEAYEMKMASLVILHPGRRGPDRHGDRVRDLPPGTATLGNPGAHGFSEILYAFSSGANNNGSRLRRPHRERALLRHGASASACSSAASG